MRNPSCTLCPLHKTVKSVCVWGEVVGKKKPKLVFVGEAPGEDEDAQARPFVGRAGQLLRKVCSELGVDSYYVTNPVKCRPTDATGTNRKPRTEELRACRSYLESELDTVRPARVVLLGASAIRAFTGERNPSVHTHRGRRAWQVNGIDIIATYHPAYILRDPDHLPDFVSDLQDAWTRPISKNHELKYEVSERLKMPTLCAFDIETTQLNPFRDGHILCAAWSNGKKTQVAASPAEFNNGVNWIGHNIKFDLLWLRQKGYYHHVGDLLDTYVMIHLLEEEGQKGLKYLAGIYTDYGNYAADVLGHRNEQRLGELWEENLDLVMKYNAYDAAATWQVYRALLPRIKEEGLETLFKMQMKLLPVVVAMEHKGVWVNQEELTKQQKEFDKQIKRMDRFLGLAEKDLNPDSPQQLVKLLESWHIVPAKKTPKGTPSVDEESLLEVLECNFQLHESSKGIQSPALDKIRRSVLQTIVDRRALKKLKTTYLDGVLEELDDKSCVHPTFNPCGTVTGRFSSSNPNVQNIPRGSPVARIYQARPGHIFVAADYSQLELRLGAHFSGDESLKSIFTGGLDLHQATADRLGIDRPVAKTVNFGIFYGMGPKKLSRTLKIPMKDASRIIHAWFEAYPGVRLWLDRTQKELLDQGYVKSAFGRRRRLSLQVAKDREKYMHMVRQACNFPIQSTGADITMMAMIRVHEHYPVVSNIHDSIIIEVPKGKEIPARHRMKKIMEDVNGIVKSFGFKTKFIVPFEVEVRSGPTWADLT